jgi:uncharacterized membrane protein YbhN (UPF0104 family)
MLAVGTAVSAVFLYIGLRGLKLSDVWHDMREVNFGWVLTGAAVYFLAVWGRTWRWHYLLRSIKPISLRALFPVVVIGYMGNKCTDRAAKSSAPMCSGGMRMFVSRPVWRRL